MKKEYVSPVMDELLICADESINAISDSQYNDGEFETWT